jgi:DNA-binding HxlR family transcriptional regulator
MNTWNNLFQKAMAHPVKRKIIECLRDADMSFSELMNSVDVSNHGKFGYHLRELKDFVELEPLTKKYRLTYKGKILAGLIRDFRSVTSVNAEYVRYVQGLRRGDHAFALYTDENFKRKISFPFLEAGLMRGEAVVYFVEEDKLTSEVKEIQRYGIDPASLQKEAFTIMSAYEWYIDKGRAHGETLLAKWKNLLKKKEKAGFTGLRGAAETEVFFNYAKSQELQRYEELLGRQIAENICALCLYNVGRVDEEQFVQVCKSHGHIIQEGIVGTTIV